VVLGFGTQTRRVNSGEREREGERERGGVVFLRIVGTLLKQTDSEST
jgi:hypothetical protein